MSPPIGLMLISELRTDRVKARNTSMLWRFVMSIEQVNLFYAVSPDWEIYTNYTILGSENIYISSEQSILCRDVYCSFIVIKKHPMPSFFLPFRFLPPLHFFFSVLYAFLIFFCFFPSQFSQSKYYFCDTDRGHNFLYLIYSLISHQIIFILLGTWVIIFLSQFFIWPKGKRHYSLFNHPS